MQVTRSPNLSGIITVAACLGLFSLTDPALGGPVDTLAVQVVNSPVVALNDTVFSIRFGIPPLTPEDRARIASSQIIQAMRIMTPGSTPSVRLEGRNLLVNGVFVAAISDSDTVGTGLAPDSLLQLWSASLGKSLAKRTKEVTLKRLLFASILALIWTALMIILIRLVGWIYRRIEVRFISSKEKTFSILKIGNYELLPAPRVEALFAALMRATRWSAIAIILYFYLYLVLAQFPWTSDLANSLLSNILSPLSSIGMAVLNYLPNLFFLAVVIFVLRIVLRFTREIFNQLAGGHITIPGFYDEWAEPTYKIVRFLILAFALVVAFPYLPGSDSPAFKGISIFIGVLFSLGSTSAIANMVAGVVVTYMRPFKIGDRVKIGGAVGDVVEKTLLSTRIRTIKNVEITIPNAALLGGHIENFSTAASSGVILHTSVTIGYDVPWRRVHELLINSATATAGITSNPPPFVLQTGLNDFHVSYELNAATNEPNRMAAIYSDLHQNIQDNFFDAGVEIMSPHFTALRDGNKLAIPEEQLPNSYVTGTFGVSLTRKGR